MRVGDANEKVQIVFVAGHWERGKESRRLGCFFPLQT